MKPVVASVPYLNAKPLIYELVHGGGVEVVYDVPSKLPAMVDLGLAAAAMASSFEAIRTPSRRVVDGVSISTMGPVESVRLFSKVPFREVGTLALDSSSLTSNHLALILLAELYGASPQTRTLDPDIGAMLDECDACVLIGDKGLTGSHPGARVLDLGAAWRELTGLPFVWALWIGGQDLDSSLAERLRRAKKWGAEHMDVVVPWAAGQTGFPMDACSRYLRETMNYDLGEGHLAGLGAYAELLKKHGIVAGHRQLELV